MQQWGIQHVALSPDIGTGRNQPFTWKHPGPRGLWGSCSTGRGSNSKNHWGWAGRAPRPGTRVQCPSVSTWGSWGDSWKVQTDITGKLLGARCASPSGVTSLQTLSGDGGYQHRPALPVEASHSQAGWHGQQDVSLGSVTWCCSCSSLLTSQPARAGRPTLAESFIVKLPGRTSPLPHGISFRRGQERKPCLQNHTASQQLHSTHKATSLRALTEERKHHNNSSHTAVISYSKSHQKRSLPFIGSMQANTFPHHKPILSNLPILPTYLQLPLASRCSGCHCCQLLRSVPQRLPWEAGQWACLCLEI